LGRRQSPQHRPSACPCHRQRPRRLGEDLVINGDYLAGGIRERASELATLELGPVTEIEQRRKLMAEIDQDRLTRIDRAMIAEAEDRFLDLRHEPDDLRGQSDRTLRCAVSASSATWACHRTCARRLGAERPAGADVARMGERGDIIRTMQKALRPRAASAIR
jgi:type IV secretory pathway VirD2 relaxase